jgi:hypothetical protein
MAKWVRIHAGFDPLEGLPTWTTEAGAAKVIARGGGLEACTTKALGQPIEIYPREGDIGLLPDKLGGLCIVYGSYVVAPSEDVGLQFYPINYASKFWRVTWQKQ